MIPLRPYFRKTLKESLRYMVIGTLASGVDGACYFLLTRKLGMWFILANLISVNIGITISFFLNTFHNFRKTERLFARAISFYSICYAGLALSMGILWFGTGALEMSDIPVKIFAVIAAGTLQFMMNKIITFTAI